MKKASLLQDVSYNEDKPKVALLLESEFTKEIRITFLQNQIMKEHSTPYPIVVEIVEGKIDFGVNGTIHHLVKGDLVSLQGGVPHDLTAIEQSTVRLTLSKGDKSKRVSEVASQ